MLELPELGLTRKVKSMQAFRRPVTRAAQGDRVGICVAGLDASLVERGVAAAPGALTATTAAVAVVRGVKYFRFVSVLASMIRFTPAIHNCNTYPLILKAQAI